MKTEQQRFEEIMAKGKKTIEEQYAKRQAADAAQMEQISAAIDKATQASTAQYEQSIADLPKQSRALYDENAMNEAVSRSRIQETLANMGLTDSGLSSSMATALTVQKGKADRQVSMNEQQQRQALMSAIDQIVAGGESQKAEQKIKMDQATRDWYDQVNAQMESSARESAATSYAADQEYAAKVAQAQIKAQQEAAQVQTDYDKQRRQYVQKQMMEGKSADESWANAYAVYPSGDDTTDNYYALRRSGYTDEEINAYMNAGGGDAGAEAIVNVADEQGVSFAKTLKLDITGGNGTAWKGKKGDGKIAANLLKNQVENNAAYAAMSPVGKEYAYAAAAGYMIANSWHYNPRQVNNTNYDRLQEVCNELSIDYDTAEAFYKRAIKENGWEFY